MNTKDYITRIGYTGPLDPTAETLKQLHRAHMLSVPFENLDIFLCKPIVLDVEKFYDKVVRQGRGGFCFELNSLFAWLLMQLGFTLTMLSARIFYNGSPGPEFDHMVLMVETEQPLIADVGFGDCFLEPLGFEENAVLQQGAVYCLEQWESQWVMKRREAELEWAPQYVFSLTPRLLSDFAGMNEFHQHSADSIFTRKVVCTKATAEGRVTLSRNRLIIAEKDRREERRVASEAEWWDLLKSHFGIGRPSSLAFD